MKSIYQVGLTKKRDRARERIVSLQKSIGSFEKAGRDKATAHLKKQLEAQAGRAAYYTHLVEAVKVVDDALGSLAPNSMAPD